MNLFKNVLTRQLPMAVALCAVALSAACAAEAAGYKMRNPADPIVVVQTDKGTIKLEIYKQEAPITSANFLDLVGRKFYDKLNFHRVVDGFVIQGGDPNGNGSGDFIDPSTHMKRTIPLEKVNGLTHETAGTLAMARSGNPNSASCQFYINLAPTPNLDQPPGYAVFGHVISGMDVVNKIQRGDHMTHVFVEKQ